MQISDSRLVLSPSDLNNFLECEHLTWLDLQLARGRILLDSSKSEMAELLAGKGEDHERGTVQGLAERGVEVLSLAELAVRDPRSAAAATRDAMKRGVPVIHQATFYDEGWVGLADFVERVEEPSQLGSWSYEVADAKLAKRAKPHFLLQLCFYSDWVAALQGKLPRRMHLLLGSKQRESYRYAEFAAYYRVLRRRLASAVAGEGRKIYPLSVPHCDICRWSDRCRDQWKADDHLSLVANIRNVQIERLEAGGIATLAALAGTREQSVRRMAPVTFRTLRQQAILQLRQRETGRPDYELLAPEPGRGFALLPPPSPGDVFFDMEGDPYLEGGLEYLFGAAFLDGDRVTYRPWWGHDAAEEKRCFEEFMDFVAERRSREPNLHVYHYAHYELSALRRLAGHYATREHLLDDFLRTHVFVDLYQVLRQSLRLSLSDYSLKSVEVFLGTEREGPVTEAGESILGYEQWLQSGDSARLEEIERYNEQDCRSTRTLRDWLLERAGEARAKFGELPPRLEEPPRLPTEERLQEMAQVAALTASLTSEIPGDARSRSDGPSARQLMAHLLEYHHREERPQWWAIFDLCGKHPDELMDEPGAIAGLTPRPNVPPEADKRSWIYTLDFPAQETKVKKGGVLDPETIGSAGEIVELDLAHRRLRLRRGPTLNNAPIPRALIQNPVYQTDAQRAALRRLAAAVVEQGCDAGGPFAAARGVLSRSHPRVRGVTSGQDLHGDVVDHGTVWKLVSGLDESHLFIQGPPGSGKTCLGARSIVLLLAQGKRVGVTANSHKAINNLLREIEEVASADSVRFRGLKKTGGEDTAFESHHSLIENSEDNKAARDPRYQLVAATSWLFSRPEFEGAFDVLFYDEAGQISLADALASATSARNLVFLGDPQQLPHVTQADHPEGSGASVLEHLLGDRQTVPPDRGLFLGRTWRLHPDVCAFVSELSYEGRLQPQDGCRRQRLETRVPEMGELGELVEAGLRYLPVRHRGNSQQSEEEALAVGRAIEALLGSAYTDRDGKPGKLGLADILVVAPYNMQVAKLIETLPAGARVGTVDKFQGQQAPVVFYSMASSSGADIPRGLEFLMSRNRLNVAISRAQCLAVLVASPELLHVRCQSIDQMRLVNALCRFVEMAGDAANPGAEVREPLAATAVPEAVAPGAA